MVSRDCNPEILFQSLDFGIEKCQSRDWVLYFELVKISSKNSVVFVPWWVLESLSIFWSPVLSYSYVNNCKYFYLSSFLSYDTNDRVVWTHPVAERKVDVLGCHCYLSGRIVCEWCRYWGRCCEWGCCIPQRVQVCSFRVAISLSRLLWRLGVFNSSACLILNEIGKRILWRYHEKIIHWKFDKHRIQKSSSLDMDEWKLCDIWIFNLKAKGTAVDVSTVRRPYVRDTGNFLLYLTIVHLVKAIPCV